MNKKWMSIFVGIALASMLLFGFLPPDSYSIFSLLAMPFAATGESLRALSLASPQGNLTAIVLYSAICLSPLLLWLKWKREKADILLPLLSALLFYVLYLQINPGLMPSALPDDTVSILYAGGVYSVLLAWGVLRILGKSRSLPSGQFYAILRGFLFLLSGMLLVSGFGQGLGAFREEIRQIQSGNSIPGTNLLPTYLICFFRFAAGAMETSLDVWMILLLNQLLIEIERDPYSRDCCIISQNLEASCRRVVILLCCVVLVLNLGQIALVNSLYNLHVTVYFPLFSLILAYSASALSKLLTQGNAIKADNDLFV